jgi:hypothetical protein
VLCFNHHVTHKPYTLAPAQVTALNDVIAAKGAAKVEALKGLQAARRAAAQMEWEVTRCNMQVQSSCMTSYMTSYMTTHKRPPPPPPQPRSPIILSQTSSSAPCFLPATQAEDVAALTQQLQLLHVTKEFQALVKASGSSSGSGGGTEAQTAVTDGSARTGSGSGSGAAARPGRSASSGGCTTPSAAAAAAAQEAERLQALLKV